MDIRKDFLSISEYLERLVQYARVFRKNNIEGWPHYKNREDFEKVCHLEWPVRKHFEGVYATGRDCAVAMSTRLIAFNYADEYPTLTDFIRSFDGGWLYQVDELRQLLNRAKDIAQKVQDCPWAVGQMIMLFEEQLTLLDAARNTIGLLKQTKLYKIENGIQSIDETDTVASQPWWKSFDRRIAVFSLVVAVLALAISAYAM